MHFVITYLQTEVLVIATKIQHDIAWLMGDSKNE